MALLLFTRGSYATNTILDVCFHDIHFSKVDLSSFCTG